MTRRNGFARRLTGVGAALVMLSSAACAFIEVSPPRPPAKKAPAWTRITPNPPRPVSRPTGTAQQPPLWTSEPIEPVKPSGGDVAEERTRRQDEALGPRDEPGVHVVSRGETLYSIARRYDVDAFAFAEYNDLPAPFALYAGQRLSIPAPGTQPAPPPTTAGREEGPMVASLPAMAQPLPSPPEASERGFIWPVEGKVVSTFGPKARGRRNDGINIATTRGAPVRAVENGVVAYAGNELRGFGNMILIKHQAGWISTYAHNDRLLVGRGDKVRRGQVIARAGSTGRADGVQLHFELRKGTTPVDPLQHLPRPRT